MRMPDGNSHHEQLRRRLREYFGWIYESHCPSANGCVGEYYHFAQLEFRQVCLQVEDELTTHATQTFQALQLHREA